MSSNEKMEFQTEHWVPQLKMEFKTEEQAWLYWIKYSGKMGFSVRKQYSHKSRVDGAITSRVFVCSSEGKRDAKDKRVAQVKHPRLETRTGCQVRLAIKLNRTTNKFEVIDFVSNHNHPLLWPEPCRLLPSKREPEISCCDFDLADDFGIRPNKAHESMSTQVKGPINFGYTISDQRNHLSEKHHRELLSSEAVDMLNYFHERVFDNPSFQHSVQLNGGEEIVNIFWADANMIADYARFGDVMAFDTILGTNKEERSFGVFVGFNHFQEIVIFGAVLMYDPSVKSFEWVFRTFLEVHNHKRPKTIFSYQDFEMEIAIANVMPDTTHGLYTWHIMENASSHLSCYSKYGMNILGEFSACVYEYEEEVEFEKAFYDLVKKVNERNWLASIYKCKEKWAYYYMKNVVSLGMRNTQFSETISKNLKNYLKSDMDIVQFLKHFERVVNKKRDKEIKSENEWRRNQPEVKINVPILQQARSLYTPKIFELFQKEYELFMAAQIEGPLNNAYTVAMCDFSNNNLSHKCHKVIWNRDNQTVLCGCRKFERMGILCWHALKVLDWMNIKVLPEQYILKRWTREAKNGTVEDRNGRIVIEDTGLYMAHRNSDLCRKFAKIAAKAATAEELSAFLDGALDTLDKQIEEKMRNPSITTIDSGEASMPTFINNLVSKPNQSKQRRV